MTDTRIEYSRGLGELLNDLYEASETLAGSMNTLGTDYGRLDEIQQSFSALWDIVKREEAEAGHAVHVAAGGAT